MAGPVSDTCEETTKGRSGLTTPIAQEPSAPSQYRVKSHVYQEFERQNHNALSNSMTQRCLLYWPVGCVHDHKCNGYRVGSWKIFPICLFWIKTVSPLLQKRHSRPLGFTSKSGGEQKPLALHDNTLNIIPWRSKTRRLLYNLFNSENNNERKCFPEAK